MTRPVVFLAALWLLSGCGGPQNPTPSPSPSASPSPSPSPSTSRTILDSRTVAVPARGSAFVSVDRSPAGAVDVRVDWGSAANDVNVFVSDPACVGFPDLLAGNCRVLAESRSTTAKPERLNFNVTGASNDFIVWIQNTSGSAEQAPLEVGLTR
jgi:hypothetical protein